MAITTLATETDVRNAGNYSDRVPAGVVNFYLELTSFLFRELIGDDNYTQAQENGSLEEMVKMRLLKAEALLTVGISLPAASAPTTQAGTLQSFNIGRTVDIEVKSITKEIMDLAANYIILAKSLIPEELITEEGSQTVWYKVYQRVFPSLSEMPTTADMHSEAEALIKEARGDESYEASMG